MVEEVVAEAEAAAEVAAAAAEVAAAAVEVAAAAVEVEAAEVAAAAAEVEAAEAAAEAAGERPRGLRTTTPKVVAQLNRPLSCSGRNMAALTFIIDNPRRLKGPWQTLCGTGVFGREEEASRGGRVLRVGRAAVPMLSA